MDKGNRGPALLYLAVPLELGGVGPQQPAIPHSGGFSRTTLWYHSQPRRVAHSTNTVHQYRAIPVSTCSSKAIAYLSA